MNRQSCDPNTITHSSIALLQERFRQLERAKEMRQQRELVRLFSSVDKVKPAASYEPSRLFFQSELILPTREALQASNYLQSSPQSKHIDMPINAIADSAYFRSTDSLGHKQKTFEESDVDTSLHL